MKNKIIKIKTAIFSGVMVLGIAGVNVAASITFDHKKDTNWDQGYRWVSASTQAYKVDDQYGTKAKISSYTRAYFERAWWQGGGVYCDSGRKWSGSATERSYAKSDRELYKLLESGTGKSDWGA